MQVRGSGGSSSLLTFLSGVLGLFDRIVICKPGKYFILPNSQNSFAWTVLLRCLELVEHLCSGRPCLVSEYHGRPTGICCPITIGCWFCMCVILLQFFFDFKPIDDWSHLIFVEENRGLSPVTGDWEGGMSWLFYCLY